MGNSVKRNYNWIFYVTFSLIALIIILSLISPPKRALRRLKAAMDVESPITRTFALELASKFPGEYNIDQLCKVYDHLYKNWKYVEDPRGVDYNSKASHSINNNLTGDCDDFAILMATTIESIGGRARITFAYDEVKDVAHAFAEAYFILDPQTIANRINFHFQNVFENLFGINKVKQIYVLPDNNKGAWLNLDWNSKYPGGPYMDYTKKYIFYPRENYFTIESKLP